VANLQQIVNLQVLPVAPSSEPLTARERAAILAKSKGDPIPEVESYLLLMCWLFIILYIYW
jgi:hypothetical protein